MADKSTVLTVLHKRSDSWTSPAQLREVIDVPERTLRNWLHDLVEEGVVEAHGERKGRRYRLRDRSIDTAASSIADGGQASTLIGQPFFSVESQAVIKRVEAPLYSRAPATYGEDWLQAYVPNESAYLTHSRREELEVLGKRPPIDGRADTYIQKIYHRLLIDFSFNSSRLEGNTYTLIDTDVDVNKRTARLASIIPLIRGDCVPQSFVELDPDSYLKATTAMYELNEVGPLADLYTWSYRRSCQRYDTTARVVGFDEIAALYRQSRRALVTDLVRAKVPPNGVADWIAAHVPANVEPQHRKKFLADVLAELEHLDASRIGGLGITRQELDAWQELRRH